MNGKITISAFFVLILLIFSFQTFAEKPEDIKLDGFVNDYAGILTTEQKVTISTELETIFNSGQAEVSVVTVKSLGGLPVEDFAFQVANGNLGTAQKNNGLLILVAVEDRKYRFEVGRGLEPIFNDAKVGRIGRDYIVPNFKNEDYFTGIYSSVLSIKSVLLNETNSEYYINDAKPVNRKLIILGIWAGIFILFFIISLVQQKKIKKKGGARNDNDFFFAALAASSMLRGGRGGNSGGGFGGFGGGGSFGGGGAGGSF